jgi:hypothetical protein
MQFLESTLMLHLPGCCSGNGNDISFWLSHTYWEVVGSEDAVKDKNLVMLSRIVEDRQLALPSSQQATLYDALLALVKAAADAKTTVDPGAKKIKRVVLLAWFEEQLLAATSSSHVVVGGSNLRTKMLAAGIPVEAIETAREQRMHYRQEVLSPRYLDTSLRSLMELEVVARLHQMLAELDSGASVASGVEFHLRCLVALQEVNEESCFDKRLPLGYLQGCMYVITDRCQHRFIKASS